MTRQWLARWVALAALAGCGIARPEEVVARRFVAAVAEGDEATLAELVHAPARERLAAAAQRAGDQVGGRRTFAPHEMLQVLDAPPDLSAARVRVETTSEDTAVATVVRPDGTIHTFDLRREDGRWRVVVPLAGEETAP